MPTSGNAQTDRLIADLIAEGKVFRCPDCQRLYGSAEWLQQHREKCHKPDDQPPKASAAIDAAR